MFIVFCTVKIVLCIYDLFHILLSLWQSGSIECMHICMYVCNDTDWLCPTIVPASTLFSPLPSEDQESHGFQNIVACYWMWSWTAWILFALSLFPWSVLKPYFYIVSFPSGHFLRLLLLLYCIGYWSVLYHNVWGTLQMVPLCGVGVRCTYRWFATTVSQLEISDFSGETFKGFEVP